jgi:glycosyltransferase involved in cell wall biosynthesis
MILEPGGERSSNIRLDTREDHLPPISAPRVNSANTNMRTVLHLTGMTSNKYGSMERYLLETVRQCALKGYASILQYESLPASPDYLAALKSLGAEVIVLATARRSALNTARLAYLVARKRPQVVHSHFLERHALLTATLAARVVGTTTTIAMVHNVLHLTPRSFARHAYNRCDHVLAVSDAVRTDLLNGGVRPEIVRTHYLGLIDVRDAASGDRERLRDDLGIPRSAVVLGNIAFDAAFKGVDVLLEALRNVTATRDDVCLLQIGVDPATSPLRPKAQQLGTDACVRWAGIRDAGWQLLQAADIYVQPSRFGEGLPLAIMEAMALRLPVVATNVAGNAEAVVDGVTGVLVAADDVPALAQGLLTAIQSRGCWEGWGNAGRERYEKLFDGQRSVENLLSTYYGVMRVLAA